MALSTRRGKVVAMNQRLCQIGGLASNGEARTKPAAEFYADPADRRRLLREVRRNGLVQGQTIRLKRKDGTTLLALVQVQPIEVEKQKLLLTVVQDVTMELQTEKHLAGVAALLKLFASGVSLNDYLHSVVNLLRDWCGCSCAGVRLPDGKGHLPYAAQVGFSRGFVAKEAMLYLNPAGCGCMRALTGETQPRGRGSITQQGSYFCNNTTGYAESLGASLEKRSKVLCIAAGYESLAHAALRYQNRMVGTIHLADRAPGKFPPETVRFLESVAPLVGEAIHRFKVEESLKESELRFRSMFERHAAVMLLIDPNSGAIVEANPAAAGFYGFSRDSLQQMNISDLNTLPREIAARERLKAVRERKNFFVFPHRLANGEVRTVEVHSSPIDVRGKTLLFSIISDITDRRALEKAVLDVTEKERQRLGQDLHDSLSSKLTGIALMGKALARRLTDQSPENAALADELVRSANELIGQTRLLAHGLCPAELADLGLAGALVQLGREMGRMSGISFHVQAPPDSRLQDFSLALHIFRIAQEAVNNAIRHAQARNIWIDLTQNEEGLCLEVRDDGSGLPAKAVASNGLGLRTMSYRANVIGAALNIRNGETGGAIVTCTLVHPVIENWRPR